MRRGTGTNGLVEAFLASDGNAFLAPFASTANGAWTGSTDRVRIGATTGTASLLIDDLVIADGGMPATVAFASTIMLAAAVPGVEPVGEPSQELMIVPLELAAPTRNRYFACVI
jgi:hypothetical protein